MFIVLIPIYEPLEVSKCEKCGKVMRNQKNKNGKVTL